KIVKTRKNTTLKPGSRNKILEINTRKTLTEKSIICKKNSPPGPTQNSRHSWPLSMARNRPESAQISKTNQPIQTASAALLHEGEATDLDRADSKAKLA